MTSLYIRCHPRQLENTRQNAHNALVKKNWDVSEGNNPYDKIKKGEVKLGDTITMVTNNQEGYIKYEVIMNEKGKKALRVIDSYDRQMARMDEEWENGTPRTPGGKNRSKKNRTRRHKK